MPFPVEPKRGQNPLEFLIEDPFGVRESILPLLSVNRTTGYLTGLGTAFSADPFGGFLTAQHVFSDVDLAAPPPAAMEEIPTAMLNMGLVFGTVGLSKDLYAPVTGLFGFVDKTPPDPLHGLIGMSALPAIITDCLRLVIEVKSSKHRERIRPLPLRCSGTMPKPGDRILAIGYPELGLVKDMPPTGRLTYVEHMYGAIGEVVAVHPSGLGKLRPWPILELRANWRSGMSGGPLFNEGGEVIGLVSSSIEPDQSGVGVGFGLWFGGFPIQRIVPFLDATNPGFYRGYGVVRSAPWHLAGMFPNPDQAEAFAAALCSGYEVRFGTNRYGTDDFISERCGMHGSRCAARNWISPE
jgi:serine protease Do